MHIVSWTSSVTSGFDKTLAVANGLVYGYGWDGTVYAFATDCAGTCAPLSSAVATPSRPASPVISDGVAVRPDVRRHGGLRHRLGGGRDRCGSDPEALVPEPTLLPT